MPEPPGRSKESAPAAAWGPRACCGAVHPTEQGKVRRVSPRCLPARLPRRGHPSASPPPRRPMDVRERSSRRRPARPAVSRRRNGDLDPWQPPCRHGWHVAPGPRQGRRGLRARRLLRRRARNAPDQVNQRHTVDGRDLAGQAEAAPGAVLSAHHRAPQTESAECTGNSSHD